MAQDFTQQIYEYLMQSQFFPPEDLKRQQLHQLEQLVRFARANTAFYSRRLDCVFDAADNFRFEAWSEVPILTRSDLVNNAGEMFAHTLPSGHGETAEHVGSGTTGQTVTTRHNALIGQVSQTLLYRAMNWHGFDYGKTIFSWFGGDPIKDRWPNGTITRGWGPHWDPRSQHGLHFALSRLDTAEQALSIMQRYKPSYATGRPNAMLEMAVEAEKQGVSLNLEAIISFSAQLTPPVREECSRIFGAEIFNRYASKEVYDIAHQCPEYDGLHVASEAMLFEVVDDLNRPCMAGQPGRVIVTPFYNTVQPLIRYDLGDIVSLGEPCRCGRSLPIINELLGRTIHLFKRVDGTRFSLRLPDLLRKNIGAREWQVAQVGPEAIDIRFIKIAAAEQSNFEQIAQTIRSQMTPRTQVTFTAVAKLPQTASGKVLEMVCELPADA